MVWGSADIQILAFFGEFFVYPRMRGKGDQGLFIEKPKLPSLLS